MWRTYEQYQGFFLWPSELDSFLFLILTRLNSGIRIRLKRYTTLTRLSSSESASHFAICQQMTLNIETWVISYSLSKNLFYPRDPLLKSSIYSPERFSFLLDESVWYSLDALLPRPPWLFFCWFFKVWSEKEIWFYFITETFHSLDVLKVAIIMFLKTQ